MGEILHNEKMKEKGEQKIREAEGRDRPLEHKEQPPEFAKPQKQEKKTFSEKIKSTFSKK